MRTFNIKIGGEAGQGLVSVGNILLRAIAEEGWYLFAHQDYESRIRGGHNFFQIRVADKPIYTWDNKLTCLTLDKTTVTRWGHELSRAVLSSRPEVLGSEAEN